MKLGYLYCIFAILVVGLPIHAVSQTEPASAETAINPLYQPSLEYPQIALYAGQEGTCITNFYLSSFGKPFNVSATCSDPVFTANAVAMVTGSIYKPKIENGKAIQSSEITLPVNFSLAKNHSFAQVQKPTNSVTRWSANAQTLPTINKYKIDPNNCARQLQNEANLDLFMLQLAESFGADVIAKGLFYFQGIDNVFNPVSYRNNSLCLHSTNNAYLRPAFFREMTINFNLDEESSTPGSP